MLEHVSVSVKDFAKAKKFYVAALKPLGYKLTMDYSPEAAGFKEGGHTSFWIVKKKHKDTTHLAFLAKSKKAVQDFHKAALKAGGKDNGGPGLREDYSPDYYAAFVYDPDGNNIEAVVFKKH
ncbi:MAG TPA: VOC family protein [Candidatus Paceibacterota bacterium]|jgi:catechol 2,3-dioxygenase-like lactoylglutathione lyase family enzyme|nr:VOC family protein [Candidatus Paceibacterota bacterium]